MPCHAIPPFHSTSHFHGVATFTFHPIQFHFFLWHHSVPFFFFFVYSIPAKKLEAVWSACGLKSEPCPHRQLCLHLPYSIFLCFTCIRALVPTATLQLLHLLVWDLQQRGIVLNLSAFGRNRTFKSRNLLKSFGLWLRVLASLSSRKSLFQFVWALGSFIMLGFCFVSEHIGAVCLKE